MNHPYPRLLTGTTALALGVGLGLGLGVIAPGAAQANQSSGVPGSKTSTGHRSDDRPGPAHQEAGPSA